jgi:ATP-dependent exoDNAse (exonuclease V) alpha subunit
MNTTTIHSLMGFYDLASMEDALIDGRLQRRLRKLKDLYDYIILDELSMFSGEELDTLCIALDQINENEEKQLGLILVGDMGQLPPIDGKWAFEANNWDRFKDNIQLLTKVWRQDNKDFIALLDLAREGNNQGVLDYCKSLNIEFHREVDTNYEGTTIFSKNAQVDSFNAIKLNKLIGKSITVRKKSLGIQLKEWNKIPLESTFKVGSYVMLLVNKPLEYINELPSGFVFSNGDCGYIQEYDDINKVFHIKLIRNDKIVEVPEITRYNESRHKPDVYQSSISDEIYYNEERRKYILGQVSYFPIRLAYAATVWKTQGLSLDKIQLDIRNVWWKSPNAVYVALSRARTLEGIRLITTDQLILKRMCVDLKVLQFHKRLLANA